MTAIVTNVLPSGAMVVAGDQKLTINGIPQSLHVTGTLRGEDIDNTDSILSSNVANIDAKSAASTPKSTTRASCKRSSRSSSVNDDDEE